jgi:hypothetical protein
MLRAKGSVAMTSSVASPLLNVTEAADYLRCSASYLNKIRVAGGGPTFVKIGARVVYRRIDLDRFVAERTSKATTQPLSALPEYKVWRGMIRRCENPNHDSYRWYGARGIRVCDRWRNGEDGQSGFECFLADMGRRPTPQHSVDRYPNNDGNYCKENCRWATTAEQGWSRPRLSTAAELEAIVVGRAA